ARDMAIVSLLACTGLRRSEAAALDWSQVDAQPDGSGRLTVTRSKTDQEGEGAVVAITSVAMRDLERWAELQGRDRQGSVFGLSGRQVSRRVAAVAKAAGLGEGFSGHSGRVGMAVTMLRNQAPSATIMRQGRWNSERMIGRYGRNETAGEALRYL
ncbi:MAG: tyrosine-type recombinase/integrase, partial [Boseongicola sp. SB0662_bin_57]|nr:tyrosine-type recombinase/integrase [Boseongicola sp. SB0662_bin_57]